VGAATKTFARGGKHPRAATGCRSMSGTILVLDAGLPERCDSSLLAPLHMIITISECVVVMIIFIHHKHGSSKNNKYN